MRQESAAISKFKAAHEARPNHHLMEAGVRTPAITTRAQNIAMLEAMPQPELPSAIERVHQAHGYLARAEADLVQIQRSLRALQHMAFDHPDVTQAHVDAALEQVAAGIETTVGNRVQLALDAERAGIEVKFFCVDHFETADCDN